MTLQEFSEQIALYFDYLEAHPPTKELQLAKGLARFRATLRRVAEELVLYLSVGEFLQSSRRDNWSVRA
jgi:hypothetical protein